MKKEYLKYYENYSAVGGMRFMWDAFWADSKLKRLSLINRQKDYLSLAQNKGLFEFHRQINQSLYESALNWKSYDYGEGYFYQSLKTCHITGLRDTSQRVLFMNLNEKLKNKRVLEIGCNTGFLSLSVAQNCQKLVGFDINPHLVKIANTTAQFLKIENCVFLTSSFEEFNSQEKFDVVMSFANHSTYDNNTRQSLVEYFKRCSDFLQEKGIMLFESHPPEFEGGRLEDVIGVIKQFFTIRDTKVYVDGGFLDKGRSFIEAVKRD